MNEHFFIGIDVSKEKFDACVLRDSQKICCEVFENTPKGVKQLLKYLNQLDDFELSNAVFPVALDVSGGSARFAIELR